MRAGAFYTYLLFAVVIFACPAAFGASAPDKHLVQITEIKTPRILTPYTRILGEIGKARSTGNIRVYHIGTSAQGRSIPMIAIAPAGATVLPKVRILIICAQHGDEPASPEVITDIINKCSHGKRPETLLSPSTRRSAPKLRHLSSVLWLVIPIANPDGFDMARRANSAGIDLNRDWLTRSQPETQAIKRVFEKWAPQIVLDLHQWSNGDPPPAENGLEMMTRPNAAAQDVLERDIAHWALRIMNGGADTVSLITSRPSANPSLAHRYFASRGAASFLIETAAGAKLAERRKVLTDLVLLISERAPLTISNNATASTHSFRYPPEFQAWFQKRYAQVDTGEAQKLKLIWFVLALWGGLVLIRQKTSAPMKEAHDADVKHKITKRNGLPDSPLFLAKSRLWYASDTASRPSRRAFSKR